MGWWDVINFGLNATQTYQIYRTKSTLNQMHEGQVLSETQAKVLELIRNLIFSANQGARELEKKFEGSPGVVYIMASAIKWRLDDIGVTTDILPDFQDKEYLVQLNEKIESLLSDSQERLSAEEKTQASQCIKAIKNMPLLENAIVMESARETLKSSQQEWNKISGKRTNLQIVGVLCLLGGPAIGVMSMIPGMLISSEALTVVGCVLGVYYITWEEGALCSIYL